MESRSIVLACMLLLVVSLLLPAVVPTISGTRTQRILVKTSVELTPEVVQQLSEFAAHVNYVFEEIDVIAMTVPKSTLAGLMALDVVECVESDLEGAITGDYSGASADHSDGMLTWNLDMVNAEVAHGDGYDGSGVYIAVLDTGLVQNWRDYFHEESIASEYGKAFPSGGTGQDAEVPADHWEKDTSGHGTAVTSVILGFGLDGTSINGVAPKATVIPLKVQTNGGVMWSSGVIAAIMHIAGLKESGEIQKPIVISFSFGWWADPLRLSLLRSAINYVIDLGIVVVAGGGLEPWGMVYPAAWPEVISVGVCGWTLEWVGDGDPAVPWWRDDVPENLKPPDSLGNRPQVYIHWGSPKERAGEDLDVVTPGSAVLMDGVPGGGAGASLATPNVAGIVALMLQRDFEDGTQDLTAAEVESVLEETAFTIRPGTALIYDVYEFGMYGFEEDWTTVPGQFDYTSWGADATGAGLIQADAAIDAV